MLMILPPLRAAIPFATRMGHLERSEIVDGDDLLPELLVRLEKRHRRVPAGVVHQDVRAGARGVLAATPGYDRRRSLDSPHAFHLVQCRFDRQRKDLSSTREYSWRS